MRLLLALSLVLAIGSTVAAAAREAVGARAEIPADVAASVERCRGCNHWLGEDGHHADRAREIARVVEKPACARTDRDEARLRRRHTRSPQALRTMDDARWLDG